MSIKTLLNTALVVLSLSVGSVAQAGFIHPVFQGDVPPQAVPAFGQESNTPPAPPVATPVQPGTDDPAPVVNPNPNPNPAGGTEQAPAPSPTTKPATPPQPGNATPATPGKLEIITDPAQLQELFFGPAKPKAPTKPTPAMLESVYRKVWQRVATAYHDPARLADWDKWQSKYDGKLKTEEDLEAALKDMLGSLKDPWTKYISTSEIKKHNAEAAAGMSELGMWIVQQPDGSYKIDYLNYGSPSYASGMHKGDVLKSAQGKSLKGLSLEDAQALLIGKDGSTIEVTYEHNGQEVTETLTVAPTPESEVAVGLMAGGIGYIRLPAFDQMNLMHFAMAMQELYDAAGGQLNGLIFDLRGNSGGLVTVALDVASLFMEKGTVVTSTTREDRMITHQSYEVIPPQNHTFKGAPEDAVNMIKTFYHVPLVVLVDGSSASASEIVTGALKDSGRATIVGTTTYGKGVGYNQSRIPPGGVLYITTLDYLTPSGYNLSNKGIVPQVVVERTPGAKSDVQLEKAVELIKAAIPDLDKEFKDGSGKKQLGEGEWTSDPLVICAAIALFLLVGVLAYRHHYLQKLRRQDEAKRDRDSE